MAPTRAEGANRENPAPVAQRIEQEFPKLLVACSTHAGGSLN